MTLQSEPDTDTLRETAASHMVTHFPRAAADMLVSQVIQSLQGQKFECADTVFVVDAEGRLKGIVRINDLFAEEFYEVRSKRMAERAAAGGKMKNAANAPSFESVDTNGDGEISESEFDAHQAEMIEKRQQRMQSS